MLLKRIHKSFHLLYGDIICAINVNLFVPIMLHSCTCHVTFIISDTIRPASLNSYNLVVIFMDVIMHTKYSKNCAWETVTVWWNRLKHVTCCCCDFVGNCLTYFCDKTRAKISIKSYGTSNQKTNRLHEDGSLKKKNL